VIAENPYTVTAVADAPDGEKFSKTSTPSAP